MRAFFLVACATALGLTSFGESLAAETGGAPVNPNGAAPPLTAANVAETETGTTTNATAHFQVRKRWTFSDLFRNTNHRHGSALSDTPIPLQTQGFPERPNPIIEIGLSPFLGQGPIAPGYVLPTGAVWQPDFIVFGTFRTAVQTFDNGDQRISEWANRLDLYGNLFLTPTERILIGFRPLDRDGLDYSGYRFEPNGGFKNDLNAYVTTFFFQGDFGELFPKLDPYDRKSIDFGFAIGRQPLSVEDGIMINEDVIDGIGITRTSLFYFGASAWRTTAFFGWNEVSRNDNQRENSAKLFGLFNSADYVKFTLDIDFAYVNADYEAGGDGAYLGVGVIQRLGLINSTTRVNGSVALDHESTAVSNGVLLFQQFSTILPESDNNIYLDAFVGIGDYASAARGGDRGGPLGQTGILFAAQGLGAYGAPLGNRANDAVGLAFGYQMFFDEKATQLTFELGGRIATDDSRFFNDPDAIAAAARFQRKLNQHSVLVLDTFVGLPEARDVAYGFRSELLLKF